MAKQKKIVPYVLNTKIPDEGWRLLWQERNNYSLDDLLAWASVNQTEEQKAYYKNKTLEHDGILQSEWRNNNGWGGPAYSVVASMCRHAYINSRYFKEVNDAFLAEYDSRADLQELYKTFLTKCHWMYDAAGHCWSRSSYHGDEAGVKFFEEYSQRPKDYRCYSSVTETWEAKSYVETKRETPFQPGDLVRLRDPYVNHCDHDPLFVSRYVTMRSGETTPDRSTVRIGTVMKVTNDVPWRASRGSKQIEVLWFGKEESTLVPEKILKWEERPTKKNGLLK